MAQSDTSSRILALHADWRMLGMLFIVFARRILRLQEAGNCEAWHRADQLELWVRSALIQCTWQLRTIHSSDLDLSAEEQDAFDHLKTIAVMLAALALYLQYLKGKCIRQAAQPVLVQRGADVFDAIAHRGPNKRPAFIDSG